MAWRLPRDVDFPIYGLGPSFVGRRKLGVWMQTPRSDLTPSSDLALDPVYCVELLHFGPSDEVVVAVHTLAKMQLTSGDRHDAAEVAGFALNGALQIDDSRRPVRRDGNELVSALAENAKLDADLDSSLWDRARVLCNGVQREALYHQIGTAWACVVDLDEYLAVAVSASGLEPGDCDLRPIVDPDSYEQGGWLREEHKDEHRRA